jgi:autotransporter translocation and assembly factor TamB
MNDLPDVIAVTASKQMNGRITIGKSKFYPTGVVLDDVSVFGSGKSGKLIARIPSVRVFYNPMLLIRSDKPADAVSRIDLLNPEIHLERYRDGAWNITGLFKTKPHTNPSKSRIEVYAKSSRVSIRDFMSGEKPKENELTDLDALIDLSDSPRIRFSLQGKGIPGRLQSIAASGWCDVSDEVLDITANLHDIDATYWTDYPYHTGLNVKSGRSDVDLQLSGPLRHLDVKLLAEIREGSLLFGWLHAPLNDISGSTYVTNDSVTIDLKGRYGSTPVAATGKVSYLHSPRLGLEVTSDHLNIREAANISGLSKYLKGINLPPEGSANLLITGLATSPVVGFNAHTSSINCSSCTATDLHVRGVYSNGRIQISDAGANLFGGSARATGSIELAKSPVVELDGDIRGADSENIPELKSSGISAVGNGAFHAEFGSDGLNFTFRGKLPEGKLGKYAFKNGQVALGYDNGNLNISEFGAEMLGGIVAASGKVDENGGLNMSVSGVDLDLGVLPLKARSGNPITGRLQFSGQLTGSADSPQFDGKVEAYDPAASGVQFDHLAADISGNRDQIQVSNADLEGFSGRIALSGAIENPLTDQPALDFTATADKLSVDAIAALAKTDLRPGGIISGRITVTGTPSDPQAAIDLQAIGASYKDFYFDSVTAQAEYAHRDIHLTGMEVKSGSSTVSISGSIPHDGDMSLAVNGKHIDLSDFAAYTNPYACLTGSLSLSAGVFGVLSNPRIAASVDFSDLAVNGARFEKAGFKGEWSDSKASLTDFILSSGGSAMQVSSATYDPNTRKLEVDASVKKGSIGNALAILDASAGLRDQLDVHPRLKGLYDRMKKPVSGMLEGHVTGSVILGAKLVPDLNVDASITSLAIGPSSLKSIKVKGTWKDKVARLEDFEALGTEANITAEGSIGPSDKLDVKVDAHNVSTDVLKPWVSLPDNFSGRADVTLIATGTTSAVSADAFLDVVDPVINGMRFDRLRARLSSEEVTTSSNDSSGSSRININDLRLVHGDYTFKVKGFVPFNWRQLAVPSDEELLLQSDLDNDTLRLLSSISDVIPQTLPDGSAFNGSLVVTGSMKSPKLQGEVDWHKGELKLPRIETPLRDIEAKITLDGDAVNIRELTGSSSEGGGFQVTGDMGLADIKPMLNLGIKTDRLTLTAKNISNSYGEESKATLDGNVTMAGAIGEPMISGNVTIPSGYIAMKGEAVPPQSGYEIKWNPGFDLKIAVQKDVQVRSALVKTPLQGEIDVAGTLHKPIITGALDISDGAVLFPLAQFRTLPGSRIRLSTSPEGQNTIRVDMTAVGHVVAAEPMSVTQREYDVTMTARGPLSTVHPTFSSSPPGLSNEQIMALVTGSSRIEEIFGSNNNKDVGTQLGNLFTTAMAPQVFQPIERAVEDILGIQQFGLAIPNSGSMQVSAGNSITPGMYMSYSRYLGTLPDYADSLFELKVSQKLSTRINASYSWKDKQQTTVGLEGTVLF